MQEAQSYIVRVYVRTRAGALEGTVEIVRTGERHGFTSPEELLEIVLQEPATSRTRRARRPGTTE